MSHRLGKCCANDSDLFLMGKWCLHASAFVFDRIIIKVAGSHDRHKSSGKFDFGPLVSVAELRCSSGVLDDMYFQTIRAFENNFKQRKCLC